MLSSERELHHLFHVEVLALLDPLRQGQVSVLISVTHLVAAAESPQPDPTLALSKAARDGGAGGDAGGAGLALLQALDWLGVGLGLQGTRRVESVEQT